MICFIAANLKCLWFEIFAFVVFAKFLFENNSHVKGTGLTQWEKAIANPKEKVG